MPVIMMIRSLFPAAAGCLGPGLAPASLRPACPAVRGPVAPCTPPRAIVTMAEQRGPHCLHVGGLSAGGSENEEGEGLRREGQWPRLRRHCLVCRRAPAMQAAESQSWHIF